MDILLYLAVAVGAYLIGSLSSAIIISNGVKKKDIRDYGSGNAGATNMLRTFGWLSGLLTFLFDAAKGVLSAWLGWLVAGDMGMHIAAVCVVIGHNWPIYYLSLIHISTFSKMVFNGFRAAYDTQIEEDESQNKTMPPMGKGEPVSYTHLDVYKRQL